MKVKTATASMDVINNSLVAKLTNNYPILLHWKYETVAGLSFNPFTIYPTRTDFMKVGLVPKLKPVMCPDFHKVGSRGVNQFLIENPFHILLTLIK